MQSFYIDNLKKIFHDSNTEYVYIIIFDMHFFQVSSKALIIINQAISII